MYPASGMLVIWCLNFGAITVFGKNVPLFSFNTDSLLPGSEPNFPCPVANINAVR
jgi:hypothetical protein